MIGRRSREAGGNAVIVPRNPWNILGSLGTAPCGKSGCDFASGSARSVFVKVKTR
jgi:hypothetical protein